MPRPRKFDDEEAAFAEGGRVERAAREAAAALDGVEGALLEAARAAAAKGQT